ncbi:hypothetical protein RIF23_07535 [Lipingzhangella sp. LS1_29]|uniref:DUF3137 domain-containing protein n=1 Tax=Lipingzhangella rawalii TaxID=2055835 RepID=A0ABU2H4B8_9ACTN|nr:hypothetical protein [Lipingzhangella rawalii]MDS1270143.1 hypothetical protein [Lipingzhangella rawalii]
MEVVIGLLVLLAFVILAVIGISLGTARPSKLMDWSQQRGWQYTQEVPGLLDRFRGHPFDLCRDDRSGHHVLTGWYRGYRVLFFELWTSARVIHSGDSFRRTTGTPYQVVAIELPTQRPELKVAQKNMADRLLGTFGQEPKLPLRDKQFNGAFRVHTTSQRFACDVLCPQVTSWLHSDPRSRHRTLKLEVFRIVDGHILCARIGRSDPDRSLWVADFLVDLLQQIPPQVLGWSTRQ